MLRIACLLWLLSVSALTWAGGQLHIITLKHRFAQDLVTVIQPLVGPQGSVSAVDHHLLVRTSEDNLRAVAQAVAALDIERQMLRVTLSRSRQSAGQSAGVRTSGAVKAGDVTIRSPGRQRSGVEVDVRHGEQSISERRQESISVLDGAPAAIAVGQLVPYSETWVVLTRRYASVQQTVQFVEVTTGFTIQPRVLGGQVELTIHPRIADLKSGGVIEFDSLATTIRLSRGEWADLGGVMKSRDEVSREILSRRTAGGTESAEFWVRVD